MGCYEYRGARVAYGRTWKHVFAPRFGGFRGTGARFHDVITWVEEQFGATFAWNDSTKDQFVKEQRRFCGGNLLYFNEDAEAFAFRIRWC